MLSGDWRAEDDGGWRAGQFERADGGTATMPTDDTASGGGIMKAIVPCPDFENHPMPNDAMTCQLPSHTGARVVTLTEVPIITSYRTEGEPSHIEALVDLGQSIPTRIFREGVQE